VLFHLLSSIISFKIAMNFHNLWDYQEIIYLTKSHYFLPFIKFLLLFFEFPRACISWILNIVIFMLWPSKYYLCSKNHLMVGFIFHKRFLNWILICFICLFGSMKNAFLKIEKMIFYVKIFCEKIFGPFQIFNLE